MGWPDGWPGDRAPRTQREADEVRSERPPGWEYLYFAGVLHVEKEALEGKYLDHELAYAALSGERIDDMDVATFMGQATNKARALIHSLTAMMEQDVHERAFGVPGVEGDV